MSRSSTVTAALVLAMLASPSAHEAGAAVLATTPFELNSNKIYIAVEVEGQKSWFILDSGAPTVFLDRGFASTLQLARDGGRREKAGLGETPIEMSRAQNVALRIGPLKLPAQDVGIMPLNEVLSGFEGRNVGGLVGNDVISRYVVEIDYERNRLRWFDPESFQYDGRGRSVPVSFDQHPFVKMRITPASGPAIEGNFLLDVGVRNALMLWAPFVAENKLFDKTPRALFATVGCGIGGEVKSHLARMNKVEIGGYVLAQPIVTMSKDTTGLQSSSDYDGILGAEILKRFKLYLDYGHGRVIFEPNRDFEQPFEFDTSGLVVIATGAALREFQVLRVMEGSPADEAGLREGDEIVTLDGRPASKLTLETLRTTLVAPGKPCEIEVRRGAEKARARITLRRLV